jgi:hypothetical protein
MFSFTDVAGTACNLSSVLKILTVPIYIAILYRAEEAIRKYRTAYRYKNSNDLK